MSVASERKLWSKVRIVPLERTGHIVALFWDEQGFQYRVRYWSEGKLNFDYFIPDELEDA